MTYCVGLKIAEGLVFLSDTRTNAGIDNISRYRKMFTWEVVGDRAIAMVMAGNLSITQGIITRLNEAIDDTTIGAESILTARSMYRVAEIVGETMQQMQQRHREDLEAQGTPADATIILGGQRRGGQHRLFLVYAAGNFIEATVDTPFFQIGEHKYGKPILDRVIAEETPMEDALKCVMVSMDSTMRSNLSVGMPLDLSVIRTGAYRFAVQRRIEAEDPDYAAISHGWAQALRDAFVSLSKVKID